MAESTKSPIGTSRVAQLTTFAAAFSPTASGEVTNFISDAPARRSMQSSLADISRFESVIRYSVTFLRVRSPFRF